jgi:hypothetical protein
MTSVTFACDCPLAHVEVVIERAEQHVAKLVFEQSGKQSVLLRAGTYDLGYLAQGTPQTPFSLKAAGGKMSSVDRTLPDDGTSSGLLTLEVPV